MTENSLQDIAAKIADLPPDWHQAGSMTPRVLEAMAALMAGMPPIQSSVETGSGKTTLLFSHASSQHLTFALDCGNGSIERVKESDLFRRGNVEFIEGSSQKTLPQRKFDREIDIALIDGPHGYPFPELEYFHLYPHIRKGGYLLLDDIQIPTITSMFRILSADKMWDLKEVVDDLAIFQRTDHKGVDPYEDGWWKQGFNESHYNRSNGGDGRPGLGRKARNAVARVLPKRVKLAAKALLYGTDPAE